MPFPSETVVTQIQGAVLWVADEFTALYSQLTAWLSIEHKDDGSHGDITADSVTATGTGSFGGDVDITGDLTVSGTIEVAADAIELNGNTLGLGPGLRLEPWDLLTLSSTPERFQIRYTTDASLGKVVELRRTASGEFVVLPATLLGGTTGTWLGDPGSLSGESSTIRRFAGIAGDGIYDKGRSVAMGVWTDVAFDANNFTANGTMTWTVASGDQNTYSYMLIGNTMFLSFKISTSSVTAPLNTQLRVAIPGGFTVASGYTTSGGLDYNQGAWLKGCCEVASGEAYVRLFTAGFGAANWAASVDLTYLQGQIIFEVA